MQSWHPSSQVMTVVKNQGCTEPGGAGKGQHGKQERECAGLMRESGLGPSWGKEYMKMHVAAGGMLSTAETVNLE